MTIQAFLLVLLLNRWYCVISSRISRLAIADNQEPINPSEITYQIQFNYVMKYLLLFFDTDCNNID